MAFSGFVPSKRGTHFYVPSVAFGAFASFLKQLKLFASHFILTIRFDSLHFSFHVEFKVFFFSQEAVIIDNECV